MNGPVNQTAFKQAAEQPAKPKRGKSRNYTIRLSEDERAYLERQAGSLTLAAYIRLQLLSGHKSPGRRRKVSRKRGTPSAELKVLSHMLAGLGQSDLASSMKDMAAAAKIGALPVTPELQAELFEACVHIRQMRRDLIAAIGLKVEE